MKRCDEALIASSFKFLRSVKHFIATVLFPGLNASSPLLFKENHRFTLHRRYFLKRFIA
jgi:hypothetical protein